MSHLDLLHSEIVQNILSKVGNPFAETIQTNQFGIKQDGSKPIVLLTGSFGTIAQYKQLESLLGTAGFYGMSISYPGHKSSAAAADVESYSLADYVQSTVLEIIYHYSNEDKLSLVGHSMAGKVIYLVLEVLAYLKDCDIKVPTVENVVLLAPSPNTTTAGAFIKAVLNQPRALLISTVAMLNNKWLIKNAANARHLFFDSQLPLSVVQAQLGKLTFESRTALMDTMGKDYALEQSRLDHILSSVNVLIVGCPKDHLVDMSTLTDTKRQLSAAKSIDLLIVESNYGHMFMLDDAVLPVIVEALGGFS